MKKLVLLIASLISLPVITLAHEGHGVVNTGPAHYMLSPEHLLPLLLVVAASSYFISRRILKRTE